jgi:hypothetical protein
MTIVIADGQEVDIGEGPMQVVVHPGEMEIEAPGRVLIDPETTVQTAHDLEQDQWELIRENSNFRKFWKALWQDVPPPVILWKGNLATRHVAGLILLMVHAKADGKPIFLKLPETYLHPQQVYRLMTMIYAIQGKT